MTTKNPFKHFKTLPEIIKLAVLYYVRFALSLRQVEDILHERGTDNCHETVRSWWNRFGPMLAKEVRQLGQGITQIGVGILMIALPGRVCLHAREGFRENQR